MPSERLTRSPQLMARAETALLVIDLQERLLKVQRDSQRIVWNARRLLEGAQALGVTVAATEQAPAKLGPTAAELTPHLPPPHAKEAFSAAACEALIGAWYDAGIRHVVLVGIETHVCVAQTALDLVAGGFEPKVVVDAVGSRFDVDHRTALRRLDASGVLLTTTEAVLFEWCGSAADPAFRTISALAKDSGPPF